MIVQHLSAAIRRQDWLKARWGEIFETSLGQEFAAYFKSRFGID